MKIKELLKIIETNKDFEEFKQLISNLKWEDQEKDHTYFLQCLSDKEIQIIQAGKGLDFNKIWTRAVYHVKYCNSCTNSLNTNTFAISKEKEDLNFKNMMKIIEDWHKTYMTLNLPPKIEQTVLGTYVELDDDNYYQCHCPECEKINKEKSREI